MSLSPSDYLKKAELRCTPQRKAIVEELLDTSGHFSTDGLHRRLVEKGMDVSRSTVYRTVSVLQENGLISEVFRSHGCAHYERATGHHDHLLCVKCGKVMEFREERIEKLQRRVCRQFDFEAVDHQLRITGICRECRQDKSGKTSHEDDD